MLKKDNNLLLLLVMRVPRCTITFIGITLIFCPLPTIGDPAFINGDLERVVSGSAEGWNFAWAWYPDRSGFQRWVSNLGVNASGGIMIRNNEPNNAFYGQTIPGLIPGRQYHVAAMMHLASISFNLFEHWKCGATLSRFGSSDTSEPINKAATRWESVEMNFTAESTNETIGCRLGHNSSNVEGVLYCDNFVITILGDERGEVLDESLEIPDEGLAFLDDGIESNSTGTRDEVFVPHAPNITATDSPLVDDTEGDAAVSDSPPETLTSISSTTGSPLIDDGESYTWNPEDFFPENVVISSTPDSPTINDTQSVEVFPVNFSGTYTPFNALDHWSFREFDWSDPFIVMQYTIFVLLLLAIVFIEKRIHDTKKRQVQLVNPPPIDEVKAIRKLMNRLALLNFVYQVATVLVSWCGRFHVLWDVAPWYYAMNNTETSRLIFMNNYSYHQDLPTDEELEAMGCGDMITSDGYKLEDPEDMEFVLYEYSPNAAIRGNAAFSMILGLLIYTVLSGVVAWIAKKREESLYESSLDGTLPANPIVRFFRVSVVSFFLEQVVFLLIVSQQALVLGPLEQATPQPYCLVIETPPGLDTNTYIRFFTYAILGIPVGVPFMVGGALIIRFCHRRSRGGERRRRRRRDDDDDDDGSAELLKCIIYLAGWMALITGVGLFGCWLVLGYVIGPWVHVWSRYVEEINQYTMISEWSALSS